MIELTDRELIRFWRMVDRRGPTECWNWKGSCNVRSGHPTFKFRGCCITAGRIAWVIRYGKFPDGLACHLVDTCQGNQKCVNWDHLYDGTKLSNARDKIAAGTSHLTWNKVSDEDVRQIRAMYATGTYTYKHISNRIGVISPRTVGDIVTRYTHKDVP